MSNTDLIDNNNKINTNLISKTRPDKKLDAIRKWTANNLFKKIVYEGAKGEVKTACLFESLFDRLEDIAFKSKSDMTSIKAIEKIMDYSGMKPVDVVDNINPSVVMAQQFNIDKLKELREKLDD